MSSRLQKVGFSLATLVLGAGLTVSSAFAEGKSQSFTGQVSDAMCGAKHVWQAAQPIVLALAWAKARSMLWSQAIRFIPWNARTKTSLAQLDKLAAHQATVTGTANADTIAVSVGRRSKIVSRAGRLPRREPVPGSATFFPRTAIFTFLFIFHYVRFDVLIAKRKSEEQRIGQGHGPQADFLYQGGRKTSRTSYFV